MRSIVNKSRPSARRGAAVLALTLAFGLCHNVDAAQDSPDQVGRWRNQAVKEALDAAGDSVSDEVREQLKDVINGLIDFRELSRRALRRLRGSDLARQETSRDQQYSDNRQPRG